MPRAALAGAGYRVLTMLSALVAPLPIGTDLGLPHLPWLLVSGRLLGSRGAIVPGVSEAIASDRRRDSSRA